MDLDQLKATWKSVDNTVAASHRITKQIARALLSDRSRGTVDALGRKLKRVAVFFTTLLGLFILILTTNPFDYVHGIEYAPVCLYGVSVIIALLIVGQEYRQIKSNNLIYSNLQESISQTIHLHERYMATMYRVWQVSFLIGFLVGLSLMARHFTDYGLAKSVLLTAGQGLVIVALYRTAKWLMGQAPDPHLTRLKAHLQELTELE